MQYNVMYLTSTPLCRLRSALGERPIVSPSSAGPLTRIRVDRSFLLLVVKRRDRSWCDTSVVAHLARCSSVVFAACASSTMFRLSSVSSCIEYLARARDV